MAQPINTTDGVIKVNVVEFAALPDANRQAARMMLLADEPGTHRMFITDMSGVLYAVSYDGKMVTPYLDLRDPMWNVGVHGNRYQQYLSPSRLQAGRRRPYARYGSSGVDGQGPGRAQIR